MSLSSLKKKKGNETWLGWECMYICMQPDSCLADQPTVS